MRVPNDPIELLCRIERYYDAAPRLRTREEAVGPLSLFLNDGAGWPYYARPRLGHEGPITATDVTMARDRQRRLGVPQVFEWVQELEPTLRLAAVSAGLVCRHHPLLALDASWPWSGCPVPAGVELRAVGPRPEDLRLALAVAQLGFAHLGTGAGEVGREALLRCAGTYPQDYLRAHCARQRTGEVVTIAAYEDRLPLAVGSLQPVNGTGEIVAVATLPSERRRGLGTAVTSRLVGISRRLRVGLVFLSAMDEEVARIYERIGFRRLGTSVIADSGPPAPL
jgi:ribosomal protein S18 acetylase RimI-like enzyme